MNIFMVDADPTVAAQSLVDRHVVKMILESCQLLSTAHRVLDGKKNVQIVNGRRKTLYSLPDIKLNGILYGATHINHPSNIWVRESFGNYLWLLEHTKALLDEYTYRYGKEHACGRIWNALIEPPENLHYAGGQTSIRLAMPDEYKISKDPVECYREYYRVGKKHLHKWTKRPQPDWI